jgi:hypothetical protein
MKRSETDNSNTGMEVLTLLRPESVGLPAIQ